MKNEYECDLELVKIEPQKSNAEIIQELIAKLQIVEEKLKEKLKQTA